MSLTPHFHIIVPIYKAEAYLDMCVRSVIEQDYPFFTLYLVDDGSPDNSGAMCDAWAQKDTRVKVFHKSNGGVLQTRRFAIAWVQEQEMTEADYAVFVDSDDWLRPGALTMIAQKIQQYNCDCLIYSAVRMVEDQTLGQFPVLAETDVVIDEKRVLYRAIMGSVRFNTMWQKAVRLDRLGTWDYAKWYQIAPQEEDVIESLEVYQNCRKFCFIPDALYCYRVNPTSITESIRCHNYRVDYTVWEQERALLESEPALTADDLAEYRISRLRGFAGQLVNIAQMNGSLKEKIVLYDRIRQTAYFREYLNGGDYNRRALGKMTLIFEAFRHRAYWAIILAAKLYRK